MSPPKEFSWGPDGSPPNLLPHSEAKLEIYRHYLRRYFSIVTQNTHTLRMAIIDGFAGGGYFNKNGLTVSGSPLIILEEMERAQRETTEPGKKYVDFKVDCHFIDNHPNHTKALNSYLREKGYGGRIGHNIHVHTDDFNARIEDVASLIRASSPRAGRAILFLDQTGYKQVDYDKISGLNVNFKRVEVMLTWAVDSFINYLTDRPEFLKAAQGSGITEEHVRQLISLNDEDCEKAFIQNNISNAIKERLGYPFYTVFFIKSPSSRRTLWLIHASKLAIARDAMMETHWDVNNASVSHGPTGFKMLGFTPLDKLGDMLPFDFERTREDEVVFKMGEDLPKILVDQYGHKAVTVDQFRNHQMNAGVMGTFEHLDSSAHLAAQDKTVQILTKTGQEKKPGAKLQKTDCLLVPEQMSFVKIFKSDD